jgi:hypothetical protein
MRQLRPELSPGRSENSSQILALPFAHRFAGREGREGRGFVHRIGRQHQCQLLERRPPAKNINKMDI